jgi:predicted RNA-binding protein with PUA-like domain
VATESELIDCRDPTRPGSEAHALLADEVRPDEFSIDDLERVGTEPWTGVRNYQARNFMRDGMKVGDGVLFYHSNCEVPGVAGIAEVASTPYPDPTQFDEVSDYHDPKASARSRAGCWSTSASCAGSTRWSLEEIKAIADALDEFALVRRGNRLSVMPVAAAHYKRILRSSPTPKRTAR